MIALAGMTSVDDRKMKKWYGAKTQNKEMDRACHVYPGGAATASCKFWAHVLTSQSFFSWGSDGFGKD